MGAIQLSLVKGNTYCLEGIHNIGIILSEDKTCTVIDTGLDDHSGKNILKVIQEMGWNLTSVINTHSHADHFGGNHYLQEQTHARIYASSFEAAIMENPDLEPYYLYSATPIKELNIRFLKAKPCRVSQRIHEGTLNAGGSSFHIHYLKGHSFEQIGIETSDHVLFTGDALCPIEIIEKYKLPYFDHIGNALATLEFLKTSPFDTYVLGHQTITSNILPIIERNSNVLQEMAEVISQMLTNPKSREEVLEMVIKKYSIPLTIPQYYLLQASVAAYLTYLCEKRLVHPFLEKSRLVWARN